MLVHFFYVTFYLGRAIQLNFFLGELLFISILALSDIGVFITGLKKDDKLSVMSNTTSK
jgi:hypothetical protein